MQAREARVWRKGNESGASRGLTLTDWKLTRTREPVNVNVSQSRAHPIIIKIFGYVYLSLLASSSLALCPLSPWLYHYLMLLLPRNPSHLDLDASSRLRSSSSYPSFNTIPSKQFSHSPSEGNYVHTNFPSQPHFSMYSSSQDQRDESLVDPWLPSSAGPSTDVSHPADASALSAPSDVSKPDYSPSHTVVSASATSLNDPTRHPRFHHTPGGSPPTRHQSFSSQHYPGSLNRHLSEPNIRSAAAHPPPHYPSSNAIEVRYQQQQRRPHHRQSFQQGTTPLIHSPGLASVSVERRPSTAGSAASSGWESRGDVHAESLQGMTAVTPTQGVHASSEIDLPQSF